MTDRLETDVEIDKNNELHMSLEQACKAGWLLASVTIEGVPNYFENKDGSVCPYKVSACCRAKLYSALVASLLELAVRDQCDSFPGARRELVIQMTAKLVSDAAKIVQRDHPEAPKPVGVG